MQINDLAPPDNVPFAHFLDGHFFVGVVQHTALCEDQRVLGVRRGSFDRLRHGHRHKPWAMFLVVVEDFGIGHVGGKARPLEAARSQTLVGDPTVDFDDVVDLIEHGLGIGVIEPDRTHLPRDAADGPPVGVLLALHVQSRGDQLHPAFQVGHRTFGLGERCRRNDDVRRIGDLTREGVEHDQEFELAEGLDKVSKFAVRVVRAVAEQHQSAYAAGIDCLRQLPDGNSVGGRDRRFPQAFEFRARIVGVDRHVAGQEVRDRSNVARALLVGTLIEREESGRRARHIAGGQAEVGEGGHAVFT